MKAASDSSCTYIRFGFGTNLFEAVILVLEQWRSRCRSKYGTERPSISRSTSLIISFNIINKVKAKFRNIRTGEGRADICNLSNISLNEVSITMVKWIKPPILFVKGLCINGICGAGGDIMGGSFLNAASPG